MHLKGLVSIHFRMQHRNGELKCRPPQRYSLIQFGLSVNLVLTERHSANSQYSLLILAYKAHG